MQEERKTLPVWQYAWRLFCFLPWWYLFLLLVILGSWLLFIPGGVLPSQFFDTLTGVNPSSLGIWGLVVLLGVVEVARILADFGWSVVGVITSYQVRSLLQRNLLQRILEIPALRTIPFSAGEAVNRFRDDVNTASRILSSWLSFLGGCLFALIGLIMMAHISLPITLLVFLPLVLIISVANRLRPKIEFYSARNRQSTGDTAGALGEMFHAIQAIKVARAEERVVDYFAKLSEQRQRASLQELLFNTILNAIFGCTTEIGMSLVLLFAASAMHAGAFTVGNFVLFVFYLDWVPGIIESMSNLLLEYRKAGVAFERLQVLLNGAAPERLVQQHRHLLKEEHVACTERIESVKEPLQVLEGRDLSYFYPDSQRGIAHVSFRLERGHCLVITGRVGSGKTTLLRTILGLIPQDQGEVCWNGQRVTDPIAFFTPPQSAYTAQVPRLFSETLRNNILLGLSEQGVDVPGALRTAVLENEFTDLDILLGPRGMNISGGQAQRTAAARMFVRAAELLVLDDLSSALDVHTENLLWERVFVPDHPALLIVSHRPEALRRADSIIVLRDGKVEARGTLAELLPVNEEVRSIWYGADHSTSPS